MIWKAVRHSFISELLTWVVGFPSTVYYLTMVVVFAWICWVVSSRL